MKFSPINFPQHLASPSRIVTSLLIGIVIASSWGIGTCIAFLIAARNISHWSWLIAPGLLALLSTAKIYRLIINLGRKERKVNNELLLVLSLMILTTMGTITMVGFYPLTPFFPAALIMVWGGFGLLILSIITLLVAGFFWLISKLEFRQLTLP